MSEGPMTVPGCGSDLVRDNSPAMPRPPSASAELTKSAYDDPVEDIAYWLAQELEEASLNKNDLVTVNREKLSGIARRAIEYARLSAAPVAPSGAQEPQQSGEVTWSEAVLLAGIQALCISANQEFNRQNGALSEYDKGWFLGQIYIFDHYTSVEKSAIAEARAYIGKLSAAPPKVQEPVRHEARMRAPNGNYGTWHTVDASRHDRFAASPDIGDGFTYEVRALFVAPSPAIGGPVQDDQELIAAAEAVIMRWYTPKWKDEQHTAVFIDRLRAALASPTLNTEG